MVRADGHTICLYFSGRDHAGEICRPFDRTYLGRKRNFTGFHFWSKGYCVLRACQAIGPIEAVREQLQERAELGADIQMLYMPPGDPVQVGRTLES